MQIKASKAEKLREFVLENAVAHMSTTSFAAKSLCEGLMSARIGMAVAANGFANARHAENLLEMCNPMAPQRLELGE